MPNKTTRLVGLFLGAALVFGTASCFDECPDNSQDKSKDSADQKGGIGSSCSDGSSSSS